MKKATKFYTEEIAKTDQSFKNFIAKKKEKAAKERAK